jgi:hypothetical protein
MEAKPRSESTVEGKPTTKSTMEAKPRSESTVEGKPTTKSTMEAKPRPESTVEGKAASAKAAPAEADCGKGVTARIRDTESASAGKGRRSQRRTGCRNRHGDQANSYFAHHGAQLQIPSTPAFRNQTHPPPLGSSPAFKSSPRRHNMRIAALTAASTWAQMLRSTSWAAETKKPRA